MLNSSLHTGISATFAAGCFWGIEAAVTEISDAGKFYPAEEYHQDYFGEKGAHSCSAVGKIRNR